MSIFIFERGLFTQNIVIIDGYIPVSDDIVEDVMLTSEDLNKWMEILINIGDMSNYSSSALREAFVHGIQVRWRKLSVSRYIANLNHLWKISFGSHF
jgi:hypothetical protein